MLGVLVELFENRRRDLAQNYGRRVSRQLCVFGHLPNEVVLHERVDRASVLGRCVGDREAVAAANLVVSQSFFLHADLNRVLQRGNPHLAVQRTDALSD